MELYEIQQKIKAPKTRYNEFGEFDYRSCEDILSVIKPILAEGELAVVMDDAIEEIGGRHYVKATVSIRDAAAKRIIGEATAYARETEERPKFDRAQLTGSASSYARKYALCGLLAIDGGGDPDSVDNSDVDTPAAKALAALERATDPEKFRERLLGSHAEGRITDEEYSTVRRQAILKWGAKWQSNP